jgi:two-component SAPR family response regulator
VDILIVDDSMLANHALKSYFVQMDPDLVTVDAVMPGDVSGEDFVKFINSIDAQTEKTTKILFISSDEIPNSTKAEIRVNDYIVKPVTLAHIENAMSKM